MYKKVYFRIETGYVWGKGMGDNEYVIFQEKLKKIFFDWELQEKALSNSCDTYKKGVSELYCHPQELVGIIDIDLIETIKKRIIESGISLYKVDIYREYENLTEEQYLQRLSECKKDIMERLFVSFATTRKNLYKIINCGLNCTNIDYDIFTIQDFENVRKKYIRELFNTMLNDGLIICNGEYARALNKTELKQYIKKNKDTEYLFLTK